MGMEWKGLREREGERRRASRLDCTVLQGGDRCVRRGEEIHVSGTSHE